MSKLNNEILILEHDQVRRQRLIDKLGAVFCVCVVESGSDLLDYISGHQEVGAVLMNLELPDMSGLELLKLIVKSRLMLNVVVYTPEDDVRVAVDAVAFGAYDYLHEPFDIAKIVTVLQSACGDKGDSRADKLRDVVLMSQYSSERRCLLLEQGLNVRYSRREDVSFKEMFALLYSEDSFLVEDGFLGRELFGDDLITVLIVDDDQTVREGISCVISRYFKVLVVSSGEEAIKLCKSGERVDVILLDVVLSDYNGVELLGVLRQTGVQAEIVVMTAYNTSSVATSVLRAGACGYLDKPFFRAMLLHRIFSAYQLKVMKQFIDEFGDVGACDKFDFIDQQRVVSLLRDVRSAMGLGMKYVELFMICPFCSSLDVDLGDDVSDGFCLNDLSV